MPCGLLIGRSMSTVWSTKTKAGLYKCGRMSSELTLNSGNVLRSLLLFRVFSCSQRRCELDLDLCRFYIGKAFMQC